MASMQASSSKTDVKRTASGTDQVYGFVGRLTELSAVMAGVITLAAVLLVSYSVIARYFFSIPVGWSVEVTEYALVFITFLVAPWVLRVGGHVKVDLIVESMSPRGQRAMNLLSDLLGIIVCVALVYYGTKVTMTEFNTGRAFSGVLRVPRYWVTWAIPAGSVVCLAQFLLSAIRFRDHGGDS